MRELVQSTGVIVIVDDNRQIGLLIRRLLSEFAPHYEVVFAQHGAGAIVQVESRFVPLVITDYHMPDMNGVEVTKEVKARSPQTRVLAITGATARDIKQRFLDAGVDYFLEKPMSLEQLKGVVIRALGTPTDVGCIL